MSDSAPAGEMSDRAPAGATIPDITDTKCPGYIEACLARIGQSIYAREKALPVIARASPEWRAWRDWRREHGLPVGLMERSEHWTVPLKWPPADLAKLEAECGQGSCVAALLKQADNQEIGDAS